ncbi:hypothetical protein LWI28_022981 [Acer negundo]|uniref:Uncharacterized protein n=1 Tax=Acer negundo TaxID=4023 RepID=A0AAD5I783_ACENE|nr:hypothetical protein LWI28_022981 [Acer negundo]
MLATINRPEKKRHGPPQGGCTFSVLHGGGHATSAIEEMWHHHLRGGTSSEIDRQQHPRDVLKGGVLPPLCASLPP